MAKSREIYTIEGLDRLNKESVILASDGAAWQSVGILPGRKHSMWFGAFTEYASTSHGLALADKLPATVIHAAQVEQGE